MVSLTRLEEVGKEAETLRTLLHGAFLDDAPRIEVSIFEHLQQLLKRWLPVSSTTTTTSSTPAATQSDDGSDLLIERNYLQEIFAATLFLADESTLYNHTVPIGDPPVLEAHDVPKSDFYVDLHVRRYCAELMVYFCFSRACQTYHVIQALYPLLLHEGYATAADGALQNHIGEGLFNAPRFLQKKMFVSGLLNGILLTMHDGVMAVFRVLLLNDRVEDSMTMDAAKHIASLFFTPMRHAWLLQEEGDCVVYTKTVALDKQVPMLCAQLVNIMIFATDNSHVQDIKRERDHVPRFLQNQLSNKEKHLLKSETIEDRLHLCIATVLNRTLSLPPRDGDKNLFSRSYKCFCLYNRHLLTPAFRALTLRCSSSSAAAGNDDTDEVLLALRRLYVLARGSVLGPSPRALFLTLEPLTPGLLDLLAFDDDALPASYCALLQQVVEALWGLPAQYEELAYILVRSVFVPLRGSFVVDRVQSKVLVDLQSASTSRTRIRGLQRLLLHKNIPKEVVCKILMATAVTCQEHLAEKAASSYLEEKRSPKQVKFLYSEEDLEVSADTSNSGNGDHDDVILVRMVEEMCIGLSADEVFGTHATLDRVCEVLATVATISHACWRWVMLLIPHALSVDVIRAIFSQYMTARERQKAAQTLLAQVRRLLAVVNALNDVTVDTNAASALESCIKALEQYNSDEDAVAVAEDDSCAELQRLVRMVEESFDMKMTATLVVHLLALSRIAEETASRIHRKSAAGGDTNKKKINNNNNNNNSGVMDDASKSRDVVRSAICLLLRVLVEVDDACAAVAACKSIVWWSLARLDAVDSSFVGRRVVSLLAVDETNPKSLRLVLPDVSSTVTPPQIGRMKVRLLDVLLGLCDYDEEARTLKNIDDYYCRLERKCTLYDILVELCGPRQCPLVQVAAMHLVGHYTVATYPRVSIAAVCNLCVDVFRHTPHEMAKAACASMLSNVTGSFEAMGIMTTLSEDEVELMHKMAGAMCTYRGVAGGDDNHESVIQHHGRYMREELQKQIHVIREASDS